LVVCSLWIWIGSVGRLAQRADEDRDRQAAPRGQTLLYADFENSTNGKPVSSRGGKVNLWGYQESPAQTSVFKGHPNDNSVPNLIRTSKTDQNHAAAFDYQLMIPNQWAGVTMEVQGQAGKPGALPPDDVSGYKFLRIRAYATGTQYLRVEIMSNGQGINLHSGYPMTSFKLKEGFNTYKVPLSAFSQPAWVSDTRVDPKDILERLTSVTISAFCDNECRPMSGMVILDDLVFEK
jgi:hypothetical protein